MKNPFSRIGFSLLVAEAVMYTAFFGLSGFVVMLLMIFKSAGADRICLVVESLESSISTVLSFLYFPVAVLLCHNLPWRKPKKEVGMKKTAGEWLLCYLLGVGGSYLILLCYNIGKSALFTALHLQEGSGIVSSMMDGNTLLLNFFLLCIGAPVIEELLFRGVILERLLPFGACKAIGISALLFGLFHGNFEQMFYATFMGLLFGWIAVRGGSVLWSILLHGAINFTSLLFAYLPESRFSLQLEFFFAVFTILGAIFVGCIVLILKPWKTAERVLPPIYQVSWRKVLFSPGMLLFVCAELFLGSMLLLQEMWEGGLQYYFR